MKSIQSVDSAQSEILDFRQKLLCEFNCAESTDCIDFILRFLL